MIMRPLITTALVTTLFTSAVYANDTNTQAPATAPTVKSAEATLVATDMQGGPVIDGGLHWIVRHGATGEILYEESDVGSVTAEIPAGVHDVEVVRLADEARAEAEIELTPRGAKLIIPLVVEHQAVIEAPETAVAGETVRVSWNGPNEKRDFVAVYVPDDGNRRKIHHFNTSNGNPFNLKMPERSGTYEIRYVLYKSGDTLAQQSIEITPVEATLEAPEQAPAGATIQVEWTGPDYRSDYVGVFAPEDGNRNKIHQFYTQHGNPGELKLPETPGTYEIRYVLYDSRQDLARQTIETTPIEATVQAPDTAQVGTNVRVSWTGPDYRSDFVGVFDPEAGNRNKINSFYTQHGNPSNLKMPDEPGTYEIRYVLYDSRQTLAKQTIEVTE